MLCVCTTAFGSPVVPEVNAILQKSSLFGRRPASCARRLATPTFRGNRIRGHNDVLEIGELRPQLGDHRGVIEALMHVRDHDCSCTRELEDELNFLPAEAMMKLAERDAGTHRRVDRHGKIDAVRKLYCDDVVTREP